MSERSWNTYLVSDMVNTIPIFINLRCQSTQDGLKFVAHTSTKEFLLFLASISKSFSRSSVSGSYSPHWWIWAPPTNVTNRKAITLQELKLQGIKICDGVVFSRYSRVQCFAINLSDFGKMPSSLCSSVGRATDLSATGPGQSFIRMLNHSSVVFRLLAPVG